MSFTAADIPGFDVCATLSGLFIYPVKSCGGIAVRSSELLTTGLAWDRAWMVVDGTGSFVSQRSLPRMALVRPQLVDDALLLGAPGMPELRVPLDVAGSLRRVRVWRDSLDAFDQGAEAAHWFSTFLGEALGLVRFNTAQRRLASREWSGDVEAPTLFSDGYPLLIASQASLNGLNERLGRKGIPAVGMERFRPNIVLTGVEAHDEDHFPMLHLGAGDAEILLQPVKPCVRCPIPNIDPATALSDPAVGDTLQVYRSDLRMQGGVTFGMNAIVVAGAGQTLQVGQQVLANYRFD